MRYKGAYRPQYILGKSYVHITHSSCRSYLIYNMIDPEKPGSWDPLDGELKEKLDKRRYVSLSRDRKGLPERSPLPDDMDDEEMSLFDIHMPGVLTLEQIETLVDLDHWLLLVHGTFVHMNVHDISLFLTSYLISVFVY